MARRARGFTLVEASICTVIVGVILVAAIATVGASRRAQKSAADRATAHLLAGDLLAEITSKSYSEPDGPGPFGVDGGELPSTRASFDDVDDYAAYVESPVTAPNGAPIPGLGNWSRSVVVEFVSPVPPHPVSATDTGAKRVTVSVTANGTVLATRMAVRAAAADVRATSSNPAVTQAVK